MGAGRRRRGRLRRSRQQKKESERAEPRNEKHPVAESINWSKCRYLYEFLKAKFIYLLSMCPTMGFSSQKVFLCLRPTFSCPFQLSTSAPLLLLVMVFCFRSLGRASFVWKTLLEWARKTDLKWIDNKIKQKRYRTTHTHTHSRRRAHKKCKGWRCQRRRMEKWSENEVF